MKMRVHPSLSGLHDVDEWGKRGESREIVGRAERYWGESGVIVGREWGESEERVGRE